ncbi:hypothetical protein KHQ06_33300 [Nocardia tengchongensis]|uniref:Uncharacterized protein n=1 Tax=Nocardia tengchongensis TaxID=2055889 RepID=A0ABX8CRR9_9NOCA|nr:hypothetical protein [Nocardia tengchongensis]QVI20905.1 hypothetical protein KHQ06_33300 [Nocardia tengchongensis]
MMSRIRRTGLAVAAIVAIALVSVSCTHQNEEANKKEDVKSVSQTLTEETAHQQIVSYLQKTADETGVGFSLTSDGNNHGSPLQPGGLMPCYDGNKEQGAHQVQAEYWVVGIPAGQLPRYKTLLQDTWTKWGWKLDPEATPTLAGVATPDNYSFILQDAGKGDGWLSVTAASPCFPFEGNGATTPLPSEIHRRTS